MRIPILYLTAKSDNMARKATKYLVDDYMVKPFDSDDLTRSSRA